MDKLIETIVDAMDDKRAADIVSLDLTPFDGAVCDTFVICNADSSTQVCAIADGMEEAVETQLGQKVLRKEGMQNGLWVAVDFGPVMVHIFRTDMRKFYALEDMWADADLTRYQFD